MVDAFLTAVRDGHEEMIRGVSVVNLPDADVQSWEIVEVSPETTEPYRLAELRAAFFDATKTWEDNIEENDKFLNDNEENTLRYRDRINADPDYKFTSGAMADGRVSRGVGKKGRRGKGAGKHCPRSGRSAQERTR